MTGPVLLAFGIWMLLTSVFTWQNALLGLLGSLIASLFQPYRFSARQLVNLTVVTVLHIPLAFWETFLMVLLPHRYERFKAYRIGKPESHWTVFAETFTITFTPKTLVVSDVKDGELEIHVVERSKPS